MTRCSTSSIGTCASDEMMLNGRTRSDVGRLKTASINARRQIFSRRNAKCCCRKGCGRDVEEVSARCL